MKYLGTLSNCCPKFNLINYFAKLSIRCNGMRSSSSSSGYEFPQAPSLSALRKQSLGCLAPSKGNAPTPATCTWACVEPHESFFWGSLFHLVKNPPNPLLHINVSFAIFFVAFSNCRRWTYNICNLRPLTSGDSGWTRIAALKGKTVFKSKSLWAFKFFNGAMQAPSQRTYPHLFLADIHHLGADPVRANDLLACSTSVRQRLAHTGM